MRITGTFPYPIGKSLCAGVLALGILNVATDAVGQTADPAGPAVAGLEVRLAELEQELRATTGRIEEMNFRLRQLSERLDKLVADVDYRLTRLGAAPAPTAEPAPAGSQGAVAPSASPSEPEATGGGAPMVLGRMPKSELEARKGELETSGRPPSTETPPGPGDVLPEGTPREQYAYGFGLMRKANYDEAETAFKEFLAAHPDDPLADNARYWLAETYYVRGDYARAAETFLEGYQGNKTGPKAPDTLLKLGMSLAALGKNKEACATYSELKRTLPDAPATIKSKADKERLRLGCR